MNQRKLVPRGYKLAVGRRAPAGAGGESGLQTPRDPRSLGRHWPLVQPGVLCESPTKLKEYDGVTGIPPGLLTAQEDRGRPGSGAGTELGLGPRARSCYEFDKEKSQESVLETGGGGVGVWVTGRLGSQGSCSSREGF